MTAITKNLASPLCEKNVPLPGLKLPQENGSLQGKRIINATEKVNALREELERTNSSLTSRIGYALLGVAAAVASATIGIVNFILIFPISIPVAAVAIAPSFIGVALGMKLAIDVRINNDGKIAATKDEAFLNWAEQKQYELDAYNISSHYAKYKISEKKLAEERRLREWNSLPWEARLAIHEAEMIALRSRLAANSYNPYHI